MRLCRTDPDQGAAEPGRDALKDELLLEHHPRAPDAYAW